MSYFQNTCGIFSVNYFHKNKNQTYVVSFLVDQVVPT